MNDTDNLIAPFFYLYDLRLWADHAMPDDRRSEVVKLLGVSIPNDYERIMDALVIRIADSAAAIKAKIEAAAA